MRAIINNIVIEGTPEEMRILINQRATKKGYEPEWWLENKPQTRRKKPSREGNFYKRWSAEEKRLVFERWVSGSSLAAIAKDMKRTKQAIKAVLCEHKKRADLLKKSTFKPTIYGKPPKMKGSELR